MIRQRFRTVADACCLGLIGLAAIVDLTGGVRVGRGWYRLSATDPIHLLYLAAAVAVVRHVVSFRPTLRARLRARWDGGGTLRTTAIGWRDLGIVTVVMTGATLWLLHDQVVALTGVADRGDPLFSMWRLAWVAHQLRADPLHLFDANIFFGARDTFAYSDATLLPALLSAPFLWIGVPVATVHGLVYVASFIAAGVTMAVLVRAVTGQLAAALVAGVIFAFMPYRFATYSHLEMQGIWLMPLAILWVIRALETRRLRTAGAAGIVVAMQCLWSLYLGAFLIVGLAAFAAAGWLAGMFSLTSRLRAIGVMALSAAVLLVPYSQAYWRAHRVVGDRGLEEVRAGSATLRDYLRVNEANRLYGPHSSQDVSAELQVFPGVAPIALTIAALVPPLTPIVVAAGAAVLVSVDATTGMRGLVFRTHYAVVPPFRAFRVPARFAMVTGVFLSLLAGVALARLLSSRRARWTRPIAVAIALFAVFELRPILRLQPVSTTAPALYAALGQEPGAVLVDLPIAGPGDPFWTDPTYLYWSTFHWHPLLNGYSGFAPADYTRLQQASRNMPNDDAVAVFRGAGARFVAVHETFFGADRYRAIVEVLDRRADVTLVATTRDAEGESRLYRLS